MEGFKVISTSTIQVENEVNGDKKIHLHTWDLQYLLFKMMKGGLLFHKPTNDTKDSSILIQQLKDSLRSTLAFFPPLVGRLVILEHKEDSTASCYISCNNAGALFVHTVAENTRVADILQPKYVPPIVESFFPLKEIYCHQGTSQPLLAVQVTELVDGIFIACAINHVVADGASYWHFLNSWAEISRGCRKVSKLPVLERWFPDDIEPPVRFPFTKEENQCPPPLPQHPIRIFRFTKDKIARLKSKANEEGGTDKISSLQALVVHLWCYVNRFKDVDPQEVSYCVMPIGVRTRMVPPLPDEYFGNAVMIGFVTMRAAELLLEAGVGKCTLEINKMIASHTPEKVRSHCESWLRTPMPLYLPRGADNVLITSNSPRIDVYANDFGWGKPVAVRTGASSIEGLATLFGGAEEGSIDIEVSLPYEILEALGNDPDFI